MIYAQDISDSSIEKGLWQVRQGSEQAEARRGLRPLQVWHLEAAILLPSWKGFSMRMTLESISGLNNSRSHTYFSNGSFDQSFPNVKASMATVRRTPATRDALCASFANELLQEYLAKSSFSVDLGKLWYFLDGIFVYKVSGLRVFSQGKRLP